VFEVPARGSVFALAVGAATLSEEDLALLDDEYAETNEWT
jgi:hypothetical protein